jgi:hypothetical protein
MPTARSMPSFRIVSTVSEMNGGECFMPTYVRNRVSSSPFSARSSPSA